jgi:Spy/CpxP family protein refolding chaperone
MGDLKLTADQQKQFEKLSSDLEKKQIATRSKIQTSRVELRDLMNEDAPDQAKVEAKEAEVTKLQGDLKTSRTTFWFDVNKMLNADQQKEWKKMLKRREARGRFSRLRGMVGRFMGGLRQRWSQHDGPDEK